LRQNRSSGESGGDQNPQRDGAFHQEPPIWARMQTPAEAYTPPVK
jgi:hypothetical protein